MNDQSTEAPLPDAKAAPPKDAPKTKKPKPSAVEPALAAYFGQKAIAPLAFFKAVHAAKLERFTSDDLAAAAVAAAANDGSGARLLALAAQSSKPKAVDRWVWLAVQSFLRGKIANALEDSSLDADVMFRRIHQELNGALSDADIDRQKQAQILLAMSLAWLTNQRQLNVVAALDLLRDSFPTSDAATRELTRKALGEGKVGTLRRLAAVTALVDSAARSARAVLEAERQSRAAVEADLRDARAAISRLNAQVEQLTLERNNSEADAADARRKVEEGQQNAGHDIVQLKARHGAFLKRRIAPLLSDAIDALEIDPPVPQIAVGRLKSAIDAIEENIE